jgi:hypothetical protein
MAFARSRPALWYVLPAGYELAENWETVKAIVADTNRALGIAALLLAVVAGLWLWRRSLRGAPRGGKRPGC